MRRLRTASESGPYIDKSKHDKQDRRAREWLGHKSIGLQRSAGDKARCGCVGGPPQKAVATCGRYICEVPIAEESRHREKRDADGRGRGDGLASGSEFAGGGVD